MPNNIEIDFGDCTSIGINAILYLRQYFGNANPMPGNSFFCPKGPGVEEKDKLMSNIAKICGEYSAELIGHSLSMNTKEFDNFKQALVSKIKAEFTNGMLQQFNGLIDINRIPDLVNYACKSIDEKFANNDLEMGDYSDNSISSLSVDSEENKSVIHSDSDDSNSSRYSPLSEKGKYSDDFTEEEAQEIFAQINKKRKIEHTPVVPNSDIICSKEFCLEIACQAGRYLPDYYVKNEDKFDLIATKLNNYSSQDIMMDEGKLLPGLQSIAWDVAKIFVDTFESKIGKTLSYEEFNDANMRTILGQNIIEKIKSSGVEPARIYELVYDTFKEAEQRYFYGDANDTNIDKTDNKDRSDIMGPLREYLLSEYVIYIGESLENEDIDEELNPVFHNMPH